MGRYLFIFCSAHFICRVKKIKKEFWKTKPTSLLTEKPLVTSLSNVSSLKPPEVKSAKFATKNCVQPFLGVYFFYLKDQIKKLNLKLKNRAFSLI